MFAEQLLQFFPKLEILSIEDLHVYEAYDPIRVAHLTKKIAQDNIFLQPILVAIADERKIVIDGVNRLEVLRRLGIRDVVAQVVNYFDVTEVELFSNHHYFFSRHDELLEKVKKILPLESLSATTFEKAEENTRNQTSKGYIKYNGTVLDLGNHTDLDETVQVLNDIVKSYLGQTDFCRRSEVDLSLSNVPFEIVFRRFTPQEIVELSVEGKKLNSGITRHVVSVYCLGLHVPLSLLQSAVPLGEKNSQLQTMLLNLVTDRGYRYYPRPVYKFDEKE